MESPKKAWVTGIEQIWLINLTRRRDRLERFLQAQPEMNGRINFLPAYDGKTLNLTPSLARLFAPNNFDWHKPTMGCALSHLSLWQRLAVDPNPSASYLILEDDARLNPSWVRKVEEAFLSGSVPMDWEVLYLGGVLPQYRENFEQNVQPVNQLVARVHPDCRFGNNPPGYFHLCAYSYILSQRGARRLLDLLQSWNGYWLQADFVAAYHTPDLSPPRRIYFLHPLISESFQDTAQGLARPYDENQGQENKVDSDIWKNDDRFGPDDIAAIKTNGLPLDIPAALGWVPDDPLSVKVLALQEAPQRLTEVKKPSSSKIQGIDKIWVINLERRKDRLEKFLINNPDIADQFSILKAYDGKKLALTPKIARLFAPNDFAWNKATMGCSLSHLELWHKLANEPDDVNAYLILEDDTKLSPGWQDIVQKAFQENQASKNWDVLYLGGVLPRNMENFGKLIEPVSENLAQVKENALFGQNPPNRYFHFGAFAYILSKHGARQILELMRLGNGAWMQADYLAAYMMPETHAMTRRVIFFNPLLAHCYQDLEEGFAKSYGETSQHIKVDSDIWHESSQFDARFAASFINLHEPYDIEGALAEARHTIAHFITPLPAKISLLHATRGRPQQALEARRLWLERASKSERVEHIFAFDHDDESSSLLKKYHHVIQMHNGYSVGAWNLAAQHSTGEILIQLSDDWDPPVGWDRLIEDKLDTSKESVLWINDAHRKDDLLCMAILTRKYYDKHGLFDPRFKNVYSDDDFTIRAKKAGAVVDARDIKITHLHPTAGHSDVDETYLRGNSPEEYERAKRLFKEKVCQNLIKNTKQPIIDILNLDKNELNKKNFNELVIFRRELAEKISNLNEIDFLNDHEKNILEIFRLIIKSKLCDSSEFYNEAEIFIKASQNVNFELVVFSKIKTTLIHMLYFRAHKIKIDFSFKEIPNWLIACYTEYIFYSPLLFTEVGESESYLRHFLKYINQVRHLIDEAPNYTDVHRVIFSIVPYLRVVPLYFNDDSLREIMEARSSFAERALKAAGSEVEYQFSPRCEGARKLKVGILDNSIGSRTETYVTLPVLNLDRECFSLSWFYFSEGANDEINKVLHGILWLRGEDSGKSDEWKPMTKFSAITTEICLDSPRGGRCRESI